jgi:D-psicose/D-tagatose/L-ribulose 3-epimerase
MKIGMNLLLWTDQPKAGEHQRLFEQIKRWGFDGVEIPIDPVEGENLKAISQQLNDLHLERTTTTALDASIADPASRDSKLRKTAVNILKSNVEKTREIGADVLCGPIFQGLGKFTGQAVQPDEWKYAVETMQEVGEYAQTLNVRIAMEPLNRFEMYFVNTMADGARFVREVGNPSVGLLADTHHGNIEESNTASAWEQVSEHIYHVHISENNRGVPGSGQAITDDIFLVLKRINYTGWLTIEAFGQTVPGLISRLHLWRNVTEHNDDAARLGIEFIRRQIEKW